LRMEASSGQSGHTAPFEVAIWCTVSGRDEDEVKEIVYKYCQQLKEFFDAKLVVKAVEVGLNSFHPT
jgi:hypothetical protein